MKRKDCIPNFAAETRKAGKPNERLFHGTEIRGVEAECVNFVGQ